jgi:hypothetical protein
MKIYDRGLSGAGADAAGALSRSKPRERTDVGTETRTVAGDGAYSLSLSGRAAELSRMAPAGPERVDGLRKSYAEPSWSLDAAAVAARLIEEG